MLRALLLVFLVVVPMSLSAQQLSGVPTIPSAEIDPSTLSDEELMELLRQLEAGRRPSSSPVSIFGLPSGFSVPNRIAFASLAATNMRDRRFEDDWDASLVFGMGFGDPINGVGITPLVDVTSLSPHHIGESGKIGLIFSRALPMGPSWQGSVSLDLQNLVTWGDSNMLDREANLTLSAMRPADETFGMPLMVTVGAGTGVKNRETGSGVFGGIGLGLGQRYAASVGWYGDEFIAGASVWALPRRNLQISFGIGDITDRIEARRFLVAVSFARAVGRRD